ncbi:MAG: DUF1178 family protein [Hyphomicrobiaceae bacterium]|nr:DUF1178 family protein [Hyphomicrobiaceae bacterium]
MIRFRLRCPAGHEFDAWFQSNAAFDSQAAAALIVCPRCGSSHVEKAVMAPSIVTSRRRERAGSGEARSGPMDVAGEVAVPADAAYRARLGEAIRTIRRHLETEAENVGDRFAEEARKIHYEEAEARHIWGKATRDEAKELLEEGISILPVPDLPDEH